jgi:hypothetical protein
MILILYEVGISQTTSLSEKNLQKFMNRIKNCEKVRTRNGVNQNLKTRCIGKRVFAHAEANGAQVRMRKGR